MCRSAICDDQIMQKLRKNYFITLIEKMQLDEFQSHQTNQILKNRIYNYTNTYCGGKFFLTLKFSFSCYHFFKSYVKTFNCDFPYH